MRYLGNCHKNPGETKFCFKRRVAKYKFNLEVMFYPLRVKAEIKRGQAYFWVEKED